jgi:hypothetical protein
VGSCLPGKPPEFKFNLCGQPVCPQLASLLERKNNMNTRRFILRLAIGLLTFLIGVGAAWALGHFNPFQCSPSERYYKYRHHRSFRDGDATPQPAFIYPNYRKQGCDASKALGKLPPPPADAPAPPPALR